MLYGGVINNTKNMTTTIISKPKYWYRTEITACVLCGHETKFKFRVYNQSEAGTYWADDACGNHFF